jgi:XTP/dITP diphosphohydrolase
VSLELVVASANPGKLRELRELLEGLALELRSLGDFPGLALPAEGEDYAANARAKALAAARGSGRPALGDDSGLEVEALGGAPGPRSARYGGAGLDDAGRNAALLAALRGVPRQARAARFLCVVALATPEGDAWIERGECRGRILDAPRGAGGFGYDPLFEVEGLGRSMAELAPAEKNRLSHRARALAALRPALARLSAAARR